MKLKKLVLTGAAGRLGSRLRAPLAALCEELVSSDRLDGIGDLNPNERFVQAELSDLAAVEALLDGAEMVVHFGAIGDEAPWEEILQSHIIASYNIWEAAYRKKLSRVVYASSIHAVGMYPSADTIGLDVAHRPDSYYGLAKCFSEDLARMYWEKRGLEAVCMRIASCAAVTNTRSLGTWLSYDDLIQLVTRAIDTPVVGFSRVYGVSNNDRAPFDNTKAGHLGYRPRDNAEVYAAQMLAEGDKPDPSDPAQSCVGGPFATIELGASGLAVLKPVD